MKTKQKSTADGTKQRQVVTINRPFIAPQTRCIKCTKPSGMITSEEAAALCDVSTREVYRWLETGTIHFSETTGVLLICLTSLAASAMKEA